MQPMQFAPVAEDNTVGIYLRTMIFELSRNWMVAGERARDLVPQTPRKLLFRRRNVRPDIRAYVALTYTGAQLPMHLVVRTMPTSWVRGLVSYSTREWLKNSRFGIYYGRFHISVYLCTQVRWISVEIHGMCLWQAPSICKVALEPSTGRFSRVPLRVVCKET